VLDPAGDKADRIAALFWGTTGMAVAVWALVVLVLIAALRRRGPRDGEAGDGRLSRVVGAATAATVLILVALTFESYVTTSAFGNGAPNSLAVAITAHQWWWEAEYDPGSGARTFITANEIHIPAGKPVTFVLKSQDVIHSFWVPNLAGKMDLSPGRTNTLTLTALKPGVYRGQCAEFCGLQHAHMALQVVAESESDFAAWEAQQVRNAAPPSNASRRMGMDIVLSSGCIACHTIRDTLANGPIGPDLTHLASRKTIAAGTLPNTRGNLQAWIADPQGIKPGNRMPRFDFTASQLQAVCDYLEGLT
jgi:cytochrome c oxidase subunit 2